MNYEISTVDRIIPYRTKGDELAIITGIDHSKAQPLQGYVLMHINGKSFLDKNEWYIDGTFFKDKQPCSIDIEGIYYKPINYKLLNSLLKSKKPTVKNKAFKRSEDDFKISTLDKPYYYITNSLHSCIVTEKSVHHFTLEPIYRVHILDKPSTVVWWNKDGSVITGNTKFAKLRKLEAILETLNIHTQKPKTIDRIRAIRNVFGKK